MKEYSRVSCRCHWTIPSLFCSSIHLYNSYRTGPPNAPSLPTLYKTNLRACADLALSVLPGAVARRRLNCTTLRQFSLHAAKVMLSRWLLYYAALVVFLATLIGAAIRDPPLRYTWATLIPINFYLAGLFVSLTCCDHLRTLISLGDAGTYYVDYLVEGDEPTRLSRGGGKGLNVRRRALPRRPYLAQAYCLTKNYYLFRSIIQVFLQANPNNLILLGISRLSL